MPNLKARGWRLYFLIIGGVALIIGGIIVYIMYENALDNEACARAANLAALQGRDSRQVQADCHRTIRTLRGSN